VVEELQATLKAEREDDDIHEAIAAKLRELGLSSYAARSLVALLGNAPLSAGQICKATGIPDSKIYYALEELDRAKLVECQHGTPTLYKPLQFTQMISNLTRAQDEDHQRRLRLVELFRKQAEPLAKARAEPSEVELAYIVKGRRNIVERMLNVIEESRKELVLIVSSRELWNGIASGLAQAKKRRVRIGVAVTPNLRDAELLGNFGDIRMSSCECNMMIADSERLVTISHVESDGAYAIVTSDDTMIRMSREYYDNPNCCVEEQS
jgi:sugar-specific transcriptional regulator TrmB